VAGALRSWLLATRPRTLPACIGPVLVGNALAYAAGARAWLTMVVTLFCALTLQVSVNLANDYFDYIQGVDNGDRLGPTRVTQSALLPPAVVRNGIAVTLALAIASGLYLVAIGGWPLFVAGLLAVVTLLAYSGGPFPLASRGLGEVAVFLFFGPVAVAGTYYVQRGALEPIILLAGIAVGLPVTAILVVNNLRDIDTDARAGKRTLAVRLGVAGTRWEFAVLVLLPFLVVAVMQLGLAAAPGLLWLPLVALPAAVTLIGRVCQTTGADLNPVLAHTAGFSLLFCGLLCAGVLLG
jgi:1,4-dihydroxy-2-naphthoate octaprenyltransferase